MKCVVITKGKSRIRKHTRNWSSCLNALNLTSGPAIRTELAISAISTRYILTPILVHTLTCIHSTSVFSYINVCTGLWHLQINVLNYKTKINFFEAVDSRRVVSCHVKVQILSCRNLICFYHISLVFIHKHWIQH